MTTTGADLRTQVTQLRDAVYRDGIAGVPGAFPRAWGEALLEDFERLFADARSRPDGTVNRGTNRFYFTVHPERLRGFVDLVTHPVVTALSAEVLGPEWLVVEVAFDVPLPASRYQPWHRDFPMPDATRDERAPHESRLQPHRRGRDTGDGPVRDRTRHALGRRVAVRPRDVPHDVTDGALRPTAATPDAEAG